MPFRWTETEIRPEVSEGAHRAPLAVVLGDTAAAVEIETRLSDGTNRRTANFFQCDAAGLIKRICVYMQMTP